jgi:hypothetical protein
MMEASVDGATGFSYEAPRPVLDREPYWYNRQPPRSHDLSADGQRFLLTKPSGTGADVTALPQIIVVQNWFEELKQRVPTN